LFVLILSTDQQIDDLVLKDPPGYLLIFDAPSQNFDMTDVKVEWEKSHPQIW
jgi:hypothetical protein